jgi:hypothetical protein
MYFSNLLPSVPEGEIVREDGLSLPIIFNPEDAEDLVNHTVRHIGDRIVVTGETSEGINIFSTEGREIDMESKLTPFRKVPHLTWSEVSDTEENPIVVVLTKGVRFYSDIPTYIEVLYINNDMMLISLVYGACAFEMADGDYIPLQRCSRANIDAETHRVFSTMDCRELKAHTLCATKGGYDKSYNQTCPLLITGSVDKGLGVRCLSNKGYVFNPERVEKVVSAEKAELEAKRTAVEAKRAENIERTKVALRAAEERKAEELARKEASKKSKARRTPKGTSGSAERSDPTKRNMGAANFLSILSQK